MKIIHSVLGNSFLMLVLFAMLFLPIGAMGLSSTQPTTEVLSKTDVRNEVTPNYNQYEEIYESSESTDLRQEVYYSQ